TRLVKYHKPCRGSSNTPLSAGGDRILKLNKKELYAGGLMLIIGLATAIGSLQYDVRSLVRMGSGYFPLLLGVALIIIALLMLFSPSGPEDHITDDDDDAAAPVQTPPFRAWILVTLGVILFIVLGTY